MSLPRALPPLVPLACALALAACGGGGHSGTSPPATRASSTATNPASTTTHTRTVTTTVTATSTSSAATSTTATSTASGSAGGATHTATAPAFVSGPSGPAGGSLAAAVAVLQSHGYAPVETSTYGPADTLHVLIGAARDGSSPGERAFFFKEATYLGTDASAPSAQLTVLAHSDSEVTLGYGVTRHGARAVVAVRFGLNMGLLTALDPIPSAASRS